MIQVAEKGKIPVYEIQCNECGAVLRFLKKDIKDGRIKCPECDCSTYAHDFKKVDEITSPDYICEDVADVFKTLLYQLQYLYDQHPESEKYREGVEACINYTMTLRDGWLVKR